MGWVSGDRGCDLLQLLEVLAVDSARRGVVLPAEEGGRRGGYGVLSAVAHELGVRSGDVGGADVLAGDHQVRDVGGVQAAERDPVWLFVSGVPYPVFEPEVVAFVAGIVEAERPGIRHDGVGERFCGYGCPLR